MSNPLHRQLILGLATGLLLGIMVSAGAADRRESAPSLDSRLQDQMGNTDFDPSGRPRQPFLVVLVDVTKDAAVARATGFELILGQPKANSTSADLLVESTAGGTVVASYLVADPRFFKREDWSRDVSQTAVMRAYIPLSADVDLISIKPVAGREDTVSAGGTFDPRPLMVEACEALQTGERDALFRKCNALGAAVVY